VTSVNCYFNYDVNHDNNYGEWDYNARFFLLFRSFVAVKFDVKTSQIAFSRPLPSLHCFVDQQKVSALPCRKQRSTEREPVNFAFDLDLATQPPDHGCIEPYVRNDPVEPGTKAFEPGLEALGGCSGLGSGGLRHDGRPDILNHWLNY
jgi:hypothetical protein